MSHKTYTTEEIVRLYYQYAPKEVMYKGEKRMLINIGIKRDFHHECELCIGLSGSSFTYISPTACRLILRPVSSLTEQELKELAVVMYEGSARLEILLLNDGSNRHILSTEFTTGDGNVGHDWFHIGEMAPLKIAQFLFSKQINFLNLPADIAVEE